MNRSPLKTGTITAGETTSAEIDLGSVYEYLLLLLPDLTGATITVQVAATSGGTYYTLDKPDGGGNMTPAKAKAHNIRIGGMQFVKIVAGTEGATRTFYAQGYN